MPNRDFSPFSIAANPFRSLDRQIDRMLDRFEATSAVEVPGGERLDPPRTSSLFMRVVGITSRGRTADDQS